ncbi:importin subunit beta-1 [Diutina catenulata]
MDILSVLENAFSPDVNVRTAAEVQLNEAAASHFDQYLLYLTQALTNTDAKPEVRILAGLGLKNQVTSKDAKVKAAQHQRWRQLAQEPRDQIKTAALATLRCEHERVGSAAAQLIAAVAEIELPQSSWPELIPTLYENTKLDDNGSPAHPENVRKVSQACIGYICEVADPNSAAVLAQANGILIAILQGVQSKEPSVKVRLTALNALVNSLEFIRGTFDSEGERNYIMQVVCEATQADDPELQASAYGCLARIMSLYYRYMQLYMERALYGLTVSGMQSSDERVACMAIEFWSTVCEEELDIAVRADEGLLNELNPERSFNFALVAIQDVLPTILTLLTKQNDDPEDDDWSVAMAAGACLQLFANDTGDYVVAPTLRFVEANIGLEGWREREAAVMAFGSILEGPEKDQLATLIQQALVPILNLMNDQSLQVKETVAWCLGRIADLCFAAIDVDAHLAQILEALLKGLKDHPKVATNCCWTLINILEEVAPDAAHQQTSPMSSSYQTLVPVLMELSAQQDNPFSSRSAAYEALASFVACSANDTLAVVEALATEVISRLKTTVELKQSADGEARANVEELQINVLALLTAIIRRLNHQVQSAADQLMELLLAMLADPANSLIEEDLLMAISAIAVSVGPGFATYMEAFMPYLSKSLMNRESPSAATAVGLVADLAQSLGDGILAYLEPLMTTLAQNLSAQDTRRDLRPAILSCFGDVATSVGSHYRPFLEFTMKYCQEAAGVEDDGSIDSFEYVASVREAVLDCYAGVVAAFASEPDVIYPYVAPIFAAVQQVAQDPALASAELTVRTSVGLLGDLAAMFPGRQFKQAYTQPWVTDFIRRARAYPYFDEKTKDAARWARDQQKRQIQ